MSNMSYCRFQNTLKDLWDCYDNLGNVDKENKEEIEARERLITLCEDIVLEGIDIGLKEDTCL